MSVLDRIREAIEPTHDHTYVCRDCDSTFTATDDELACPRCGSEDVRATDV